MLAYEALPLLTAKWAKNSDSHRQCIMQRAPRLKKRPKSLSISEETGSFFAPCGFSSSAARAGDSVSELKAEITVEIAMVNANCL